MTFKLDTYTNNIDADIFLIDSATGTTVNSTWNITKKAGKTYNCAGVTLNASNNLVLATGYDFYLMGSPVLRSTSQNVSSVVWQFYDETNSTYIGQPAAMRLTGDFDGSTLQGIKSCRALVLDSEITGSSIEVSMRIKTLSGTLNTISSTYFDYTGYPMLTVIQRS